MTTPAREPSIWELAGCILGDGKESPEQRLENKRMAREQWAQCAKDLHRFHENSGHVEIRTPRDDLPDDAGSMTASGGNK